MDTPGASFGQNEGDGGAPNVRQYERGNSVISMGCLCYDGVLAESMIRFLLCTMIRCVVLLKIAVLFQVCVRTRYDVLSFITRSSYADTDNGSRYELFDTHWPLILDTQCCLSVYHIDKRDGSVKTNAYSCFRQLKVSYRV